MPKASDVSVLIVDDQQSMRGICKYILTQLGFKDIIEAKSGRDALGKLEKSNVQLIISDWNMEDIDGLTLLRVIRKHPNVYADISANFYRPWSYYNAFRYATEWDVLHKLLFGSDYPIASPQETMDALYRVNDVIQGTALPPVPIDKLEGILHRDSLTLLGLNA